MAEEAERQGADITAADMVLPHTEPSRIQEYFAGSTVLITGATGFLGKLILEKLMRTCPNVRRIYVLIRPKRDKSAEERFSEFFDNVLFERVHREQPQSFEKVQMMVGDCALPMLGISASDLELIKNEVNHIFHSAATVSFGEKLRLAVEINVRATGDIIKIAKESKELTSLVYVSTAYSHCPKRQIHEEFYAPPITGPKLLTLIETLDDDILQGIVPVLKGPWPNTYAYTKSVAEDVIRVEAKDLPIAVVRPSIVISTVKEPVAGWIDNLQGATGIMMGAAVGLIRTMHCEMDFLADLVPADYVVNCVIAAAWDIGTQRNHNVNQQSINEDDEQKIPIYNYVSAPQKPITWSKCMSLGEYHMRAVPSTRQIWHYFFVPNSSRRLHQICGFFLHWLPAYIADFLGFLIGKQPKMVKTYKKINKFINVIAYFATQQWFFQNKNTQDLWGRLNEEDQKLFGFNMATVDWDLYFYTYVRGARVYLFKDSLDTLPEGERKYFRLKVAHYSVMAVLVLVVGVVLYKIWKLVLL